MTVILPKLSESQFEVLDGICTRLAMNKVLKSDAMDLATFSCPVLDFSDEEIDKAIETWRDEQKESVDVVDFHDPSNADFKDTLLAYGAFEVGVMGWGMLVDVDNCTIEGILAALGCALRAQLRHCEAPETLDLHSLRDRPFELALFLAGRLRGCCDLDGENARLPLVAAEGVREDQQDDRVAQVLCRVVEAICQLRSDAQDEKVVPLARVTKAAGHEPDRSARPG